MMDRGDRADWFATAWVWYSTMIAGRARTLGKRIVAARHARAGTWATSIVPTSPPIATVRAYANVKSSAMMPRHPSVPNRISAITFEYNRYATHANNRIAAAVVGAQHDGPG